jgi:hypothetical protein
MTMRDVDDGMIKGIIQAHRRRCDNCGVATTVIFITDIDLRGLHASENMIVYRPSRLDKDRLFPINLIGIGCGCYGKANRQLAYIKTQYADKG